MYLDRVIPSKYGQHLPPYFIFQKSFWCPNSAYSDTKDAKTIPLGSDNELAFLAPSRKYEKVE